MRSAIGLVTECPHARGLKRGTWDSMSAGGKDKSGITSKSGKKKSGLPLDSPLDLTGTEATRANLQLGSLPVSKIDPDRLQVQLPTTAGMTIRVADVVACNRPTATALADLGHQLSLPDWKPCSVGHCITRWGWLAIATLPDKRGKKGVE